MLCRSATIMIKRTIVIWQKDYADIKFFALEGDYTKFNDFYIGTSTYEELEDELSGLVWNEDYTEYRVKMLESFPHHSYVPGTTAVITAGIIP